jgi:3-methyladenine DNA glycosylase AlkD
MQRRIDSSPGTVPELRRLRQAYSKRLARSEVADILTIANQLVARETEAARFVAYELVQFHRATARQITEPQVLELGREIDSWSAVDAFAYCITGPAWKSGNLADDVIFSWTGSADRWWRRLALASTVLLHRAPAAERSVARTLAVCERLASDRDDMVVKALSWALRTASKSDPDAVRAFVRENESVLAARVKREVANKLRTGLKTPKRGS